MSEKERIEKIISELVAPRTSLPVEELLNPIQEDDFIPREADATEFLLGASEDVKDDDDKVAPPFLKEQLHKIAIMRRVEYSEDVSTVFFIFSLRCLCSSLRLQRNTAAGQATTDEDFTK